MSDTVDLFLRSHVLDLFGCVYGRMIACVTIAARKKHESGNDKERREKAYAIKHRCSLVSPARALRPRRELRRFGSY